MRDFPSGSALGPPCASARDCAAGSWREQRQDRQRAHALGAADQHALNVGDGRRAGQQRSVARLREVRVSLNRIIKDLIPFIGVVLACLMVISYVPQISLALRDLVYAR